MASVTAEWTGMWPCLCHGQWILKINGIDMSELIPEYLINEEMSTYSTYSTWHFDENYMEQFESYEDGLQMEDWIEENDEWLSIITDEKETKEAIFKAIQEKDFRRNSCGGCI